MTEPTEQCSCCGANVSQHPDAGQLAVSYCGDCGKATCGDCRDETSAQRCKRCSVADAPIEAQVSTAVDTFYTDIYTIHTIADNGNGRTFKAGTLTHADTIAKRYPVAVVLCNGVQLCVWANGVLVQGAHSDRCRALDADYMRERSANLSAESDWNGCE